MALDFRIHCNPAPRRNHQPSNVATLQKCGLTSATSSGRSRVVLISPYSQKAAFLQSATERSAGKRRPARHFGDFGDEGRRRYVAAAPSSQFRERGAHLSIFRFALVRSNAKVRDSLLLVRQKNRSGIPAASIFHLSKLRYGLSALSKPPPQPRGNSASTKNEWPGRNRPGHSKQTSLFCLA